MEKIPEFIANHLFLFSLFLGLSALLLWNIFGNVATGIQPLSPAEMTRIMNHEQGVVLDIRKNEDFKAGHIINSVNIPENEIAAKKGAWTKYANQPVILYCSNGTVSPKVARTMRQEGLEKLYYLKGGLASWRQSNLPVTS
ncbi:MAG TPA: rhodanese-like domain-containing protein [Gammaproteobacteria bacterium]